MAANDGEHPVTEIFPGAPVPAGTGAPGSAGIVDLPQGEGGLGVLARPYVTSVYQSVQDMSTVDRVPVTYGDGVSNSDDLVVPETGDPLTGLHNEDVALTGAGEGTNVMQGHHPNSMARPR